MKSRAVLGVGQGKLVGAITPPKIKV
ncbi:hypothetical protein CCACVL1_18985 [Corchorus capsularis]|uniref:Uncharacterized protein n=1 Tax=Corchorus capsularis TaxID=210143 RepID=A0A1R3HJ40_COCAP|nr:hypothetical protein CCACVL1_18985 [Corchorus capsularis]